MNQDNRRIPAAPAIDVRNTRRLHIQLTGAVQGVGFRPFVHNLATSLQLTGWVINDERGVTIEVEGSPGQLDTFERKLITEHPPLAMIISRETTTLDPVKFTGFQIRESRDTGEPIALILPDIATCADCRREVLDPENRRYRYPFTNCTNCGPRYSIIDALPYDRKCTSMAGFVMCPDCQREYEDPADRRFHAQPNACPVCGPQLARWDRDGTVLSTGDQALRETTDALRMGHIVALKGLGGFHLMTLASDANSVRTMRKRKGRGGKPFALMVPDLEWARRLCRISDREARTLTAPEHPILLLRARPDAPVSREVAPGNPYLGILLPYTPLHLLLMQALNEPIVATSGNRSEEPICIDEQDALKRLSPIADSFLVHDRPIRRHVDDAIVRVIADREMVLRRARGFAPLPVPCSIELPERIATGGSLKNTVAVSRKNLVFVSQHIGDLDSPAAIDAFESVVHDLQSLYRIRPVDIVSDLHPDYPSTRYAAASGLPHLKLQHHAAHALACMAENQLEPPVQAIVWDGTGYGTDGTVWGGEWFRIEPGVVHRTGSFRRFRLPGGDAAVREPRRTAAGLLHALGQDPFKDPVLAEQFSKMEQQGISQLLKTGRNAPMTSSVGRLFDAVSALLGIRQTNVFEGEAAMALEFQAIASDDRGSYPTDLTRGMADWGPMVTAILTDRDHGVPVPVISRRFHRTLARTAASLIQGSDQQVLMSGGCFQNGVLLELTREALLENGHRPYWHQRIPTGDGGISLGQAGGGCYRVTDELADIETDGGEHVSGCTGKTDRY